MPPLTILIKPVSSACNISCSYCFYRDEAQNRKSGCMGIMTGETAENIIKKASSLAQGSCSLMFQGGEPLLAGLDFYKGITALEKRYSRPGLKFENAIQTNGTLIDDGWAEFFAENRFLVGLSLDGYKELHDYSRDGSFKAAVAGAEKLRRYEAEFNILSVITNTGARHFEKSWNFFMANGFDYLQFIPAIAPIGEDDERFLSKENYSAFLDLSFRLWLRELNRGNTVYVRHIDNFLGITLGLEPEACNMSGRCSNGLVTEADGSVFPCDFYCLDKYLLGNINTSTYEEMASSPAAKAFIGGSEPLPEECKSCRFYSLCRNGCRRERDKNGRFVYCESYKCFFEKNLDGLIKAARRLTEGR